jgi:hypothetical protein
MEAVSVDVQGLLAAGKTYQELSDELKQMYPGIPRGLSVRSVRRFVKDNNLKGYADSVLKDAVEEAIGEVSSVLNTLPLLKFSLSFLTHFY